MSQQGAATIFTRTQVGGTQCWTHKRKAGIKIRFYPRCGARQGTFYVYRNDYHVNDESRAGRIHSLRRAIQIAEAA